MPRVSKSTIITLSIRAYAKQTLSAGKYRYVCRKMNEVDKFPRSKKIASIIISRVLTSYFNNKDIIKIDKIVVNAASVVYGPQTYISDIFANNTVFQAFLEAQREIGVSIGVKDFTPEGIEHLLGGFWETLSQIIQGVVEEAIGGVG